MIKNPTELDHFKNGLFNNHIASTIKGLGPTAFGTIEVQFGNLQRETIPVRYLHPVCVALKNTPAVVIQGDLCGRIVKVKKVEGDMAEVAAEPGTRRLTKVVTAHLCKFF